MGREGKRKGKKGTAGRGKGGIMTGEIHGACKREPEKGPFTFIGKKKTGDRPEGHSITFIDSKNREGAPQKDAGEKTLVTVGRICQTDPRAKCKNNTGGKRVGIYEWGK